jgi:hypothetical protein
MRPFERVSRAVESFVHRNCVPCASSSGDVGSQTPSLLPLLTVASYVFWRTWTLLMFLALWKAWIPRPR